MVIYDKIQLNDIRLIPINGFKFPQCMLNDQVNCFLNYASFIFLCFKMHQLRFFKVWILSRRKSNFFIFQFKIDRIYICGGFNGQECMNSAEYFDPKTNQWTMIAPMRNRRSGIGLIAYHNSIYAMFEK